MSGLGWEEEPAASFDFFASIFGTGPICFDSSVETPKEEVPAETAEAPAETAEAPVTEEAEATAEVPQGRRFSLSNPFKRRSSTTM